jgi:hypothetical protein
MINTIKLKKVDSSKKAETKKKNPVMNGKLSIDILGQKESCNERKTKYRHLGQKESCNERKTKYRHLGQKESCNERKTKYRHLGQKDKKI